MPRPTLTRWILATLAAATLSACTSAYAHPYIRRWQYEASVISITAADSYFVDLRRGDSVSGFLSFDTTSIPFFSYWYDHAWDFPVVSAVLENPRSGSFAEFKTPYALGVGVYDNTEDFFGEDTLWLLQQLNVPEGWPEPAEAVIGSAFFTAPQAITGSALPNNLVLDNWDSAWLEIEYDSNNEFVAEIHTLTPIDIPLLPGDFNGDLLVDRRDFGVWQYVFGSEHAHLAADANLDDRIDGADFLAWQRGLGSTAPATAGSGSSNKPTGTHVPEPAAGLLAVVALLGLRRISNFFARRL